MRKCVGLLAVMAAVTDWHCHAARADWVLARERPPLFAAELATGAATTAAYLVATNHNHSGISNSAFWGLTTVACVVAVPVFGALVINATEHRQLTSREVFAGTANCLVPFLGGWFWNAQFDAHPAWQSRPTR